MNAAHPDLRNWREVVAMCICYALVYVPLILILWHSIP